MNMDFDDEPDVPGHDDLDDPPPSGSHPFRLGTHLLFAGAMLGLISFLVTSSVHSAGTRLNAPPPQPTQEKLAAPSDLGFCTDGFKAVLRRVLDSCGLLTANERRGCTPSNVKQVAAISDQDFNALFNPIKDRGAVLEFDQGKEDLSDEAIQLLEKKWADSRGASIFLVVARASPEGSSLSNQALSHKRANSVLFHLEKRFHDPELEQKVGLLWLGEEYAQLPAAFCSWEHAGVKGDCDEETINRSAFVAWIDCAL